MVVLVQDKIVISSEMFRQIVDHDKGLPDILLLSLHTFRRFQKGGFVSFQ